MIDFGMSLIYLDRYWIWIIRTVLFIFVFLFMAFISHKIKRFKIKRKEVKYHLFFSLVFMISYFIIYIIVAQAVYLVYHPVELDTLKNVENIPIEILEPASKKIIFYDLVIVLPLIILAMLAFSTFFIKKYYELDLKSSFKLALILVILFEIVAFLIAIPGAKLFAYIQFHPTLKYLY